MTIKRRLVFSHFRMIAVMLLTLIVVSWVFRILIETTGLFPDLPPEAVVDKARQREWNERLDWWQKLLWPLALALFALLFGVINNILTVRLTRSIVKPLEPLGEGVKQIGGGNLAFRIDYRNDDEFRPICEAFNEMAAKLEASERQKQKDAANRRELIAGISHDLRTPLTAIEGYLEGLETGVAATAEMRRRYFTAVKNKTAVMEHIIEQLFMFSKLDMDEFPLTPRRVDIGLALADMTEEAAAEYEERGLEIRLAGTGEGLFVSVDPLLMRNVIFNILENSVQYKTKERGGIDISAAAVNHAALLRFADDGPGVRPGVLENLFDVFYRTDPSRNTKGSGLGLAISAKIIERMGGSIHAELPAAGGLAVVITLPLLEEDVLS
jgi:signal transduction histidine kinase